MYKKNLIQKSKITVNESYEGETIEQKISRIVNNKEPITDGAPLIYTDRKDGVAAEYDIRTDRWEIAVDAMDKVTKSIKAKREQKAEAPVIDITKKPGDGGAEPIQATSEIPQ